jgi:hypothetical protein
MPLGPCLMSRSLAASESVPHVFVRMQKRCVSSSRMPRSATARRPLAFASRKIHACKLVGPGGWQAF